ncbi:MAG: PepSY-associated TM helix domain-containing protein [Acidobacteriaceae bacterium]|nr:PepSY-associated TM helix domain-containing protein [Acidobacteriaceae bacterium]
MHSHSLRRWYWLHRWTSLVCTIFLLVSCLTGLPLIFGDEIQQFSEPAKQEAAVEIPPLPLQHFVELALADHPGSRPLFVTIEDDSPKVNVALMLPPKAKAKLPRVIETFNARTGAPLSSAPQGSSFVDKILELHRSLFAGVPGELFMGAMALLFVLALLSGFVIYGPFMRRLPFATVRPAPRRTHWLDLHNLLGAAAMCWMLVVGVTGAMNAVSTPLFALWRTHSMATLLAPYKGHPPAAHLITPDEAANSARHALPQMKVTGIVYPDPRISTPWHFLIYTKGRTPITSRIFTPVLVDATSGTVTSSARFPWYIHTLEVSRPLHFGDYGGLPLKILWAAFDLAAIAVLISGIVLWIKKGKAEEASRVPARATHMKPQPYAMVYRWPAVLALLSFAGLLSALLGDGVWNVLSWLLLLLPLAVMARGWAKGRA